jgi:hypothetical protein
MCIRESVKKITNLIHTEINEEKLIEEGDNLLDSLRNHWHSQKDEFSQDDIVFLQKISTLIETVVEFTLIIDNIPRLVDRVDVDVTMGTLYSVAEKVDGLAVAARVHKEMRGLLEKRARLPSRGAREKDIAIDVLNLNTALCRKCGAKMVIREGNGNYFWGCSSFPKCWVTSALTKKQLNTIPFG